MRHEQRLGRLDETIAALRRHMGQTSGPAALGRHRARPDELERAQDCLAVLGGFAATAGNPLYHQKPIPGSIKYQLLGALVDALPVLGRLPHSTRSPLTDLLTRLRATRVQDTAD